MLNIIGFNENVRNVYRVVAATSSVDVTTLRQLRVGYLSFLSRHQPHMPLNLSDDPFIVDDAVEAHLSAAYSGGSLDDLRQNEIIGVPFPPETKAAKIALCRRALDRLVGLDEQAATLFDLVIHTIFTRDHRTLPGIGGSLGGSSSNAIGAIWVSLASLTDPADITELFVHELTHHLLFIDELNHGHFNYDKVPLPGYFARSAVLKKMRPLDKVVHSVAVATEVLMLRRLYPGDKWRPSLHPDSPLLRADILDSVRSIKALEDLDDLVTVRVRDVLDRCVALVELSDRHSCTLKDSLS